MEYGVLKIFLACGAQMYSYGALRRGLLFARGRRTKKATFFVEKDGVWSIGVWCCGRRGVLEYGRPEAGRGIGVLEYWTRHILLAGGQPDVEIHKVHDSIAGTILYFLE